MYLSGAQVQPTTHIIPEGTESVNGSDVVGGCQAALSDQRQCGLTTSVTISYLIDDNIPVLNTAAPNWASQLVTVRKNSPTMAIPYDHVLLIFDYFFSPVSLLLVELNLFYCPEWNIGAPNITVYVDEDGGNFINYVEGAPGIAVRGNVVLSSKSSCDSLLPVRIPLKNTTTHHNTWYIVVSFDPQPEIEWVHVGEVTLFEPPPLPVPSELHNVSTHQFCHVCFHNSQPQAVITDSFCSQFKYKHCYDDISVLLQLSLHGASTTCTYSAHHNYQHTWSHLRDQRYGLMCPIEILSLPIVTVTGTPTHTSPANTCSREDGSSLALIAVSAVSLLLSVLLVTVVVVQCVVIGRMRKSLLIRDDAHHNQIHAEATPHGTIPVSENEAYGLHKRTTPQQEAVYEYVQETRDIVA